MQKEKIKSIELYFAIIMLLIQLIILGYYQWTNFYTFLSSDTAADLILANHMSQRNEWFLCADWVYGSEIHFLHNQLLMVPLFKFFSGYRMVFFLAFIIGTVLNTLLCIWVIYEMCENLTTAVFGAAVMLTPVTELYSMAYGQLFSWAYVFFLFLFWGCFLHWKRTRQKRFLVAAIGFSFFMGMCGLRFFIILFIPFVLIYLVEFVKQNVNQNWPTFSKIRFIEIGTISFSAFLGLVIFVFYISPVYGNRSGSATGMLWGSSLETMENFLYTPFAFIECLGGFLRQNSVLSTHGIAQIVIYAAITVFYGVIIYSYKKEVGEYTENSLLIRRFMVLAIGVNLLMIGFTEAGHVWGRLMEIHYLCLALIMLFPLWSSLVYQLNVGKWIKVCCGILAIMYILAGDAFLFAGAKGKNKDIPEYANWLMEQQFEYGWSYDFWNGAVTTAYTDGKIEVDAVKIPEYSIEGGLLIKKSNSDRIPEFIIFSAEDNAVAILRDSPYDYSKIYSDNEIEIYSLKERE